MEPTLKRVVVLGASGGTGSQVVRRALEAGYTVTAVHRRQPEPMPSHERLSVVLADPLQASDLRRVVRGAHAVVHAIGPNRAAGARVTVSGDVMEPLIQAMREEGVRRLLFVSAWGTGATRRGSYAWILWKLIRARIEDKERAEAMLRASDLSWVVALPTILTNGPATGRYRSGSGLTLPAVPTVARADVADFLVRQVEDDSNLGQAVEITGGPS